MKIDYVRFLVASVLAVVTLAILLHGGAIVTICYVLIFIIPALMEWRSMTWKCQTTYKTGIFAILAALVWFIVQVTYLHHGGIVKISYVMGIASITDSAGYIFGKTLGVRKIFPYISPNKTLAGVVGGTVSGSTFAAIFGWWKLGQSMWDAIIIGFMLSVVAQIGDLTMSYIKRQAMVKDTGSIIPGHGGVLDRIDSLIAVILACFIIGIV